MRYRLTPLADEDIGAILAHTAQSFGPRQLQAYVAIIERGLEMIAQDPRRVGSVDRSEVRPGLRMFHLELAAGRRGASSHCLYYIEGRLRDGAKGVIVVRVLHDRMEPRLRILETCSA